MQEQLIIEKIEDLYEQWTDMIGNNELSIDEFFYWISEKIEKEKSIKDDD